MDHLVHIYCWYLSLTLFHRRVFEMHFPVNGGLVMSSCSSIIDLKTTPDSPRSSISQWCFPGAPLPIFSWIKYWEGNHYCPEIILERSSLNVPVFLFPLKWTLSLSKNAIILYSRSETWMARRILLSQTWIFLYSFWCIPTLD